MRRRLLAVAGLLVGVLLVALMAPLVGAYAEDRTQDLFVDRLTDATRFAVLAEDTLEGGSSGGLVTDLERYGQVYGGAVAVVNANRQVVATSQPDLDVTRPEVARVVDQALAGSGSPQPETFWPWREEVFVLGAPVGRDAQVLGAVVVVAPTDSVRTDVAVRFGWLALAGLSTLALTAVGVVAPFVRWILRPVHDLDVAARRLAGGDLSSRVPARTGPPELRELAGSFNQMADNVEISQQQQRDLIADASHQLGNPLTALRLRIENLGDSCDDVAGVDRALEETDRLNRIVESLLDLSQVGAHRPDLVEVEVATAVRKRCEMWRPVLAGLTVEAPESAVALATADLVDLVLDALLDNAAKFAGGSPVSVSVRVGERVVLAVRDHGPGLHAEDVEKVGRRFFRGRQHQNVAGTGLGLAIVRARVLDVGGAMTVARADGGGLRVEVALRRAAPGSSAAPPDAGPAAR
ncbi:MAG TPA: HAMP domain-containing sensor histidine kinase [Nocardioidaceae bacterium]|nr:HAMP domain-containing sensor histidine kinase [Nocardioidaceae bacterium]